MDLLVGDPVEEHKIGVEIAGQHYGTAPAPGKDIVVGNAYANYNECMLRRRP